MLELSQVEGLGRPSAEEPDTEVVLPSNLRFTRQLVRASQ